jgi:hypothetical protein
MRGWAAASIAVAALAAAAVASFGLAHLSWTEVVGVEPSPMVRFAWVLLGGAALVGCASLVSGWSSWVCAFAIAVAAVVLTGHAGAGAAVLVFAASSAMLGGWVLRALRSSSTAPRPVEACLMGGGLYGSLIGFAAAKPVHYVWVYVLALALPFLAGPGPVRRELATWAWPQRSQGVRSWGGLLVDALSAGVFLVYVLVALLPEIGADALAMHLFVPAQLAQRHVWAFDVSKYVWAVMPMLADWIFGAAYMLGGETAARLLNVALLAAIALLARELVRWCGGGARAQRWAVLLLLSTPLTFAVGSSLFIEITWTAFVLAGLLALLRAGDPAEDLRPGSLAVAGLFLGLALAAKAVTLTLVPVLLVLLVARPAAWRTRANALGVASGVVLLLALGSFPYVNAWVRTRNPVFPFFNGVFRSRLYPIENFESASVFSKGLHWDFPYAVVFKPVAFIEGLTGAGGFQWLLVLLPAALALLFARERRALALLAAAIAMVWIAFQSVAYLRYVFPAFVVASAMIAVALEAEVITRPGRVVLAAAALAAVALNLVFFGAASPYRDFAFTAALDRVQRLEWLELRQPVRRGVTVVNELNKGGAPVAVLANPALGQLAADALIPNWYNFGFERELLAQRDAAAMARLLHDAGVEYVLLDADWPRAGPRQLVEDATEPVASFARVTVRRWKPEYRFQQELLTDTTFRPGGGWQVAPGASRAGDGLWVTAAATATQSVPVQPGRTYLNEIRIACPQPGLARAQVNWGSASGVFLKADIRVLDCGPQPTLHEIEVVAPAGAAVATVYASAHGPGRVQFLENSFRR